jgi:Ser/Thr protein kinase RdoA (MazF antagonist)
VSSWHHAARPAFGNDGTIDESRAHGPAEAAIALVAARWGVAVVVDEMLVDHRDRAVLRTVDPLGRPVVVKADVDPGRLRREATALAAAARAGVPVPTVRDHLDASPAILVLDHVAGRPLTSTSRPRQWREVGRQLRRLHDHASPDGVPVFGAGSSWWGSLRWLADESYRWCREHRVVDPRALDRLAACMRVGFARDDALVECLLHGDCGPYHWLLRRDTVAAVVDFGDTGRGDPGWDLAVLTLWDRQRLSVVLDGYGIDRPMRDQLNDLLTPYTVVRHLLAIGWLVEHGFDPTPTVTELHRIAASLPSGR